MQKMCNPCQFTVSNRHRLRQDYFMKIRRPECGTRRGDRRAIVHALQRRALSFRPSRRRVPRFEFTRILVPIDFTWESEKPLRYASLLAETHGGKVLLLHVTKPIKLCVDCGYGPVNREVPDEPQARRDRSRLRRFAVNHLRESLLNEILIRNGEAAEQIISAARERKADLIVLCAHEETAGKDSIRSHQTTEHVARFAPCPVLVVRRHEQDFARATRSK